MKAEIKTFIKQAKEFHFELGVELCLWYWKRLSISKVGKVGCYLHGDGFGKRNSSDETANFEHKDYKGKLAVKDKILSKKIQQFDIIVSNPPYSVSAFRNAARQFIKGDFELYNKLTDNSSKLNVCLLKELNNF